MGPRCDQETCTVMDTDNPNAAASCCLAGDRPLTFVVHGMDCAEEVKILRRELQRFASDESSLQFDLIRARLTITPRDASTTEQDIVAAVARTGMRAVPLREGDRTSKRYPGPAGRHTNRRVVLCAASGILTGLCGAGHVAAHVGVQFPFGPIGSIWGPRLLCGAAILCGGWHIFPRAVHAARRLQPDMNLLMTVAVIGATVLGEWFEAATVTFLFSLALLLETWSVGRARRAIAALLDLSPTTARCRSPADGAIEERPVDEVPVGATVLVRPWEKVPLDGFVISGATAINEAPITGESIPVEKTEGAEVFAGTLNLHGAFEFRVTRAAPDTTLARIVHMVEEAQARRAPTEQWVDAFARWYTPAMMGVALLVAVVPPVALGQPPGAWFYESLVFLVIACPCALVISTPVSIVAGLAAAARAGVLIKGGIYLETPARLRAAAFDKTGTLTQGRPEVQRLVPLNGHTDRELLARAAALEANSGHPLAEAVLRKARADGVSFEPAALYRAVPGQGGIGRIGDRWFWLGNRRMVLERGVDLSSIAGWADALQDAGHSVVILGNDAHVCGLIGIADAVRPHAAEAVRRLKRAGIRRVAVLTGDNEGTAHAVAQAVGADEYHAELMPEDKVRAVERLLREHGVVAMLGDGVNDAPAMTAATVGIAMGAAGSDAAIETADIALMADDLLRVPWLINHSRRTLGVIRENIALALGIKALFVILTMAGAASLWMAIAADMGASLLVIGNGLRLLRAR